MTFLNKIQTSSALNTMLSLSTRTLQTTLCGTNTYIHTHTHTHTHVHRNIHIDRQILVRSADLHWTEENKIEFSKSGICKL